MPRRTPDFNLVRELARDLGDVEESTTREDAFIKVRGKLLTWIPVNKSAEPGSLAVRIDLDHRAELLEADPDVYYLTDHYLNFPVVLVRLSRIHPDALHGLLRMAWSFVTAKPKKKPGVRKARN